MHASLIDEPLGDHGVALRPRAALPSWSEAHAVGPVVAALRLAVDPAVRKSLLQRLIVGELRRRGRTPFAQDQPYALGPSVMCAQPSPPRRPVADNQLRQLFRSVIGDFSDDAIGQVMFPRPPASFAKAWRKAR